MGDASPQTATTTNKQLLMDPLNRPRLNWETVHKQLEQMVAEQTIFKYEDSSGRVAHSKNPIAREKVLF